jgi:hypothetical protein
MTWSKTPGSGILRPLISFAVMRSRELAGHGCTGRGKNSESDELMLELYEATSKVEGKPRQLFECTDHQFMSLSILASIQL